MTYGDFPPGYGANCGRPTIRIRWSDQTLIDPSPGAFRVRCPVCDKGVLRVRRKPPAYKLNRRDYCLLCVQRFEYIDETINGETFA